MSNQERLGWELAGLDAEGGPLSGVPWHRPPQVWLVDGRIHWRYVQFAGDDDPADAFPVGFGPIRLVEGPRATDTGRNLLPEFLNLAVRDPAECLAFGRRWGVLHLCEHQLPRTHPPFQPALVGDEQRTGPYCQTVHGQDVEGSEAVSGWLAWSIRARAVLNVASALADTDAKVDLAHEWAILDPNAGIPNGLYAGRSRLSRDLGRWLRLGAVQPQMDLNATPRLSLGGPELFGAIALRLVMAVTTGTVGLAFCHECGESYVPKRQPTSTRRNFCEPCRSRGVPGRYASSAYRSRLRARNEPLGSLTV